MLSRILGMLRDTVMVSQFGIGASSDAYQLALLIPDMVFMLVAGGGLSSAFIPVFSEYWHTEKKEDAWKVFSTIVIGTLTVSLALVSLAWAYTPQIIDYFRDKKPVEIARLAEPMAHIVLPAQIAFLVGSVLLGVLYARMIFIGPALAPNVYNLGSILGGLLLPRLFGFGIESMAWGALGGAIVGNILIPIILLIKAGSKFPLKVDFRHPGVKQFFLLLLPVILGFSLPSMANIITQKFASTYGEDGINTILRYANNLMQAPLGILGQSLALAAFPVLAEFYATKQMDKYRDQMTKTLRTVVYLSLPAAALLFGFAEPIVNVLYGYGKASAATGDLKSIAVCLQVYALGITAWCVQPILMRGFFSLQKTFLPIAIGSVLTVVFIGLCALCVNTGRPYWDLAWASNIAALLLALALYFALEKRVGSMDLPGIFRTFLKSAGAAMTCGALAYLLTALIKPENRLVEILFLFIAGLSCFWVYVYLTKWAGMPESDYLDRALSKRKKRVEG